MGFDAGDGRLGLGVRINQLEIIITKNQCTVQTNNNTPWIWCKNNNNNRLPFLWWSAGPCSSHSSPSRRAVAAQLCAHCSAAARAACSCAWGSWRISARPCLAPCCSPWRTGWSRRGGRSDAWAAAAVEWWGLSHSHPTDLLYIYKGMWTIPDRQLSNERNVFFQKQQNSA